MENASVIKFLIEAKKATYAGKGPENSPSRPDSHDLAYEKEDLKYIDTYLGSAKFAGEEALWLKNKPIWAMNYAGRVLTDGFSGDFLKEALLQVPKDMPLRGPKIYTRNHYIYKCTIHGNFNWFHGHEEIYFEDTKVYECMFHGGEIQ